MAGVRSHRRITARYRAPRRLDGGSVRNKAVRDILHHLDQVYGTKLSAKTVSRITDHVLDEVRAWQDRPT